MKKEKANSIKNKENNNKSNNKEKSENTKTYCMYCGTENKSDSKKCTKCGKKLNSKPHDFIDYLKSKIKEEYKDKVKDNLWSVLKNFIISHLYGTVVALSVIFTVSAVIVTNIGDNYIEQVSVKPNVVQMPKYVYAGENLGKREICEKYVNAILSDDIETVKGLQLENFYPEIYKEFVNYYNNGIKNNIPIYNLPHIFHDLVANAKIYTAKPGPSSLDSYIDIDKDIGVQTDKGDIIKSTDIYTKYNVDCLEFYSTYYADSNPNNFELLIFDEIEFIEIDGNYYIIGEGPFYYWTTTDLLAGREVLIQQGNGDMSQIEPFYTVFNENGFITDDELNNAFNLEYWRNYSKDASPLYEFYGYGL